VVIVREMDAALRLVTQPDHAALAAELLALLRLPGLVEHPRRRELLRAVRLHDNGWQELDAAPRVERASGRPHAFLDLPDALRLEVWARGTRRYREREPYLALLVGEHARTLFAHRRDADGWRELLAELDEARTELLARCALDDAALRADYRFLDLADRLSLVACNGWREPLEWEPSAGERLHGELRRGERGGEEIALLPFPLAGATTFTFACRHVPVRRFDSDTDLAVALASARWESASLRLVSA
jgi:hypothetical protein